MPISTNSDELLASTALCEAMSANALTMPITVGATPAIRDTIAIPEPVLINDDLATIHPFTKLHCYPTILPFSAPADRFILTTAARSLHIDFRSKTEMVFHARSRSWSRTCSQVSTSFGLRSCASTRRRISSSCSGETATGSDSMLFQRDSTIRNRSETGNVVNSDIVCCISTALLTSN